ncbi:phospholipid-binding protein MlaC [Desulfuromonas acetoxidans]|nr:ABC transporter substrate-binding protein [Desulfuromonas acetoxidans]MBF0645403.1 ABC transporter substrate-binding protein [Desulfuromonas acetoxidans]NVD24209.1 ABC transporter substrate-binding protein [Desulfuromonas acetoxidans]NVE15018.1 ABC transporter substrate-binding protein [Desulfuromonas acetoxidans]
MIKYIACLILCSVLVGGVAVAQPGPVSPRVEVQTTVDAILNQLRTLPADSTQRRQTISDLIREQFDFELMSQGALGRSWQSANTEQRRKFIELFTGLLEETYLGRIQSYTNEKISYGEEEIRQNRAVVETVIHTASVEIPISYKLFLQNNDWQVYDVIIEKVSLIRNYRSSYATILRRKGMDGLLEEMKEKLDSLHQRADVAQKDAA